MPKCSWPVRLFVLLTLVSAACNPGEADLQLGANPSACTCKVDEPRPDLWPDCTIRYFIHPDFDSGQKDDIRRAFAEWEKHIPKSFSETTEQEKADIALISTPFTAQQIQDYQRSPAAKCPDASPVPLAVAAWFPFPPVSHSPANRAVTNLNPDVNWDGKYPWLGEPYSFYATALHEIGHNLGLRHLAHPEALMYCTSHGQEALHAEDIAAVQQLFPEVCDHCAEPEFSTLRDPSDGQVYRIVKIRDRWWMAENLNFDAGAGSFCYGDSLENCNTFGRLYQWPVAMQGNTQEGAQGICPAGWHIPSQAEFVDLFLFAGVYPAPGLIEGGCTGFNALYAGNWDQLTPKGPNFYNRGTQAIFWSSTQGEPPENPRFARAPRVIAGQPTVIMQLWNKDQKAFSVRCVKDR